MSKGTYAAVKFNDDTYEKLAKLQKDLDLPNPLKTHKIHTTVLYSRKFLPHLEVKTTKFKTPLTATISGYDVWKTKPTDGSDATKCLVIKLDSPELCTLHSVLMDLHKAEYDYDEYHPHITLSYDIGDFQLTDLLSKLQKIGTLNITEFYVDDLKLNWAKDEGTAKP